MGTSDTLSCGHVSLDVPLSPGLVYAPDAPAKTTLNETENPPLDAVTILHILRNPHGWAEHLLRAARLQGADLIEQLQKDLNQAEMTLAAMGTNR
jgi:hypothetical protein